ncbi:MAG TPA: hypothetical protein VHW72_16210 [Candidatus Angelobacter sp.]|nr:hypothetical protein [Candidatus Angelobacter sp.]
MIKIPFLIMSLRVARGVYNPEKERFHYYVSFKPTLDPTEEERGAEQRSPVDVAFSVTETGDLADLAFSLPPPCRSNRSLEYLSRTHSASVVEEKVFITVPGENGDLGPSGQGPSGIGRLWPDHRPGNQLKAPGNLATRKMARGEAFSNPATLASNSGLGFSTQAESLLQYFCEFYNAALVLPSTGLQIVLSLSLYNVLTLKSL